jgi:hypothetical protein
MRILFDHGTPAPLIPFLEGHAVTKAKDRGWDTLTNGDLLAEAEGAGFDVLLTGDQNMAAQQNLKSRGHQLGQFSGTNSADHAPTLWSRNLMTAAPRCPIGT